MNETPDAPLRLRRLLACQLVVVLWLAASPVPCDAQEGGGPDPAAGGAIGPPLPAVVQLSFDGVDVNHVVRWLAEMTRKSVVRHKDVNCQLTIVSPRELPLAEARRLVYRALALEGYSVIESEDSILLLPEAEARKLSPSLAGQLGELEGKQIVVKVFGLLRADPERLKEQLKAVLSETAKVEVDAQAGRVIITDTADNVGLATKLIAQLDVETEAETVTRVFPLAHARADELTPVLEAVFTNPMLKLMAQQQQQQQQQGQPPKANAAGASDPRFMADRIANRIIVTAPPERMAEIEELITTLDQEKPADVTVRVLDLENLSATDLVKEIAPLYTQIRGESAKDRIEIAAHTRSNKLVILSSQQNYDLIEDLVGRLDTVEAVDKVVRSFPLENADPEEIAEHLTELYETSQGASGYYYSYYRYQNDEEGDKEVRFVADRRRSAVIAIGPPAAIEQVGKMIDALDEPVGAEELAPRIYRLQYVSAFDVEELLNELFLRQTRQRGYWDWEYGYESEDRDIGKLYGKVRVTSEFYTNSIIVSANSQEAVTAIEEILEQLDKPTDTGDTTKLFRLKFAKAVALANNLNIIFAQEGAPPRQPRQPRPEAQPGTRQEGRTPIGEAFELEEEVVEEAYYPWLGSSQQGAQGRSGQVYRPVSDLVGKVRVVADVRTNSLLVSCNAHLFPEIERVIRDLDVPTAQVLMEARIIEVSSDYRDRFGVRWSPDGSRVFDTEDFDDSVIAQGSASYSEVFAGSLLENAMRTGIIESAARLDILLQFLRKNTDARIKAEPRLNVADNELGKLFVGARVPFISDTLTTPEGGSRDSFQYLDVGIILEVTPHINEDGDVALAIRVESSQIRPGETLFGGAIIDTRNYRTDMTVGNGHTLVLGGIIQTEHSEVERKVPILGDIPLLGYLFKKKDSVSRDVELMVFLRPTVTRTPEDVRRLMEEERRKAKKVHEWQKELEAQAHEAEAGG